MKKIGLALGGGGAKGIAHIPMLELLDELGVRPHRIAGTDILDFHMADEIYQQAAPAVAELRHKLAKLL